MALRPLFQWETDEQGRAKLDGDGKRIPHRKAGQVKLLKEMTAAEKRDFEDSIRRRRIREEVDAKRLLNSVAHSLEVLQAAPAK